jgi:AcrR family transcriptional regulator
VESDEGGACRYGAVLTIGTPGTWGIGANVRSRSGWRWPCASFQHGRRSLFWRSEKESMKLKRSSRVRRPSRRKREQEFRNRLVLEAAEAIFASQGFQAAGMDEIAREAELSLATLYKLFGGKEELFAAVVAYGHERFLAEAEDTVATSLEPLERLDQLVAFVFQHFERHRDTFRIYVGATYGFPGHRRSELGEETFARYVRFLDLITGVLREGSDAHAWASRDHRRLAAAIVGVLHNLLRLRHTASSPLPLEDDIAFARETVRNLVPAGIPEETRARPGGRRAGS